MTLRNRAICLDGEGPARVVTRPIQCAARRELVLLGSRNSVGMGPVHGEHSTAVGVYAQGTFNPGPNRPGRIRRAGSVGRLDSRRNYMPPPTSIRPVKSIR